MEENTRRRGTNSASKNQNGLQLALLCGMAYDLSIWAKWWRLEQRENVKVFQNPNATKVPAHCHAGANSLAVPKQKN